MDPGWFMLYVFLLLEVAVVTLLLLPVPANAFRRLILQLVSVITSHQYVRIFAGVMLALDAWYFWDSFEYLYDPRIGRATTEEEVIQRLRKQRGAYITGFGMFLFVVAWRLVDLQKQICSYREQLKGAGSGRSPAASGTIPGVKAD